jgi:hypothetical protein
MPSVHEFMCDMSIASVKQSLMNGVTVVHRISCTAIEPRHGPEVVRPDKDLLRIRGCLGKVLLSFAAYVTPDKLICKRDVTTSAFADTVGHSSRLESHIRQLCTGVDMNTYTYVE